MTRCLALRVLPDTNVLVSAVLAGGPPRRILDVARAGRIELVVPDLVTEELVRVLTEKRRLRQARLGVFLASVEAIVSERPGAPLSAEPRTGDPDDDRILACAIEHRVDVIVSGNRRHMLPLGTSHGVRILTPQALLAELRTRPRSPGDE